MKNRAVFLVALSLWLVAPSLSGLTIKMGTVAPENSPWDAALRSLAQQWSDASGGSVTLKLYPGSVAGDEDDMLRKIRIGQLQAAALSGEGLKDVVKDVVVLDLPFLFKSQDEFNAVLAEVTPDFKKAFAEKGFVLVSWGISGWINFFSRDPVVAPADLMAQKLSVSGSDPDIVAAWTDAGFHVVPVQVNDIMASLSSGMIDAIYTEPLGAAAFQWFGIAKNMCALRIDPLITGIVMSDVTWQKIPDDERDQIQQAADSVVGGIYGQTQGLEQQAQSVMIANGLTINQVPPDVAEQWRSLMITDYQGLAGKAYSREMYDRVVQLIADYRSSHGG